MESISEIRGKFKIKEESRQIFCYYSKKVKTIKIC